MKIAVTERFIKQEYGGGNYYINNANVKMFEQCGVLLIPVSSLLDIDEIVEMCDGLFVPGGCDVDPNLYGEELNGSIDPISFIDKLDMDYIDAFYKAKKPILGICRGIQILNVYFGGTLYQDIKNHDDGRFHDISVEKNSFLYSIYQKDRISVNSYHHQAIKELAFNLKPIAYSDDGYIEAVEGDNVYAVQFHPEHYDGKHFLNYFVDNVFGKRCI